ncbi:hypothetical protein SASPL_133909 [Salvia splendens]|uniref:C3H1-type domain-containing protein n=1 Tax=Salvia splendens TaxID=180675 RepID=A0A8X8X553_SALSN|nr:hypothetical protein SASPL_133909 [Salvia splendens]
MPLGKYYCDYCDKQFQDTPPSRRRHLNGVAHQRAKALWYDALRSSSQSQFGLDQVDDFQSISKGVCHRFVRTGSCQYGESCKYHHPKNLTNMNAQRLEGTTAASHALSGGIPDSHLNGGATLPGNYIPWQSNGDVAWKSTSIVVTSSRRWIPISTLCRLGIGVPPFIIPSCS